MYFLMQQPDLLDYRYIYLSVHIDRSISNKPSRSIYRPEYFILVDCYDHKYKNINYRNDGSWG